MDIEFQSGLNLETGEHSKYRINGLTLHELGLIERALRTQNAEDKKRESKKTVTKSMRTFLRDMTIAPMDKMIEVIHRYLLEND